MISRIMIITVKVLNQNDSITFKLIINYNTTFFIISSKDGIIIHSFFKNNTRNHIQVRRLVLSFIRRLSHCY